MLKLCGRFSKLRRNENKNHMFLLKWTNYTVEQAQFGLYRSQLELLSACVMVCTNAQGVCVFFPSLIALHCKTLLKLP